MHVNICVCDSVNYLLMYSALLSVVLHLLKLLNNITYTVLEKYLHINVFKHLMLPNNQKLSMSSPFTYIPTPKWTSTINILHIKILTL